MTVSHALPGGRRPARRATTKRGTDMRRIEGEIVIDYRWGKCSTSLSMSETRRAAARASCRTIGTVAG
jgi:hypothetical protein